MAIKDFRYLTLSEAVKFHILYMRKIGETRIGVFDKNLIDSALARPIRAAEYENADIWLTRRGERSVMSRIESATVAN